MEPVLFATLDVARTLTGLFFAISGYHKLFNKQRHESLVATLRDCGVPGIPFMQWWVPGWEFVGGLMLISGWWPLVLLGGAALIVVCSVACLTDGRKRIASYMPIDKADVIDDVLYLPEFLYIVLIVIAMAQAAVGAAGWLS